MHSNSYRLLFIVFIVIVVPAVYSVNINKNEHLNKDSMMVIFYACRLSFLW